jgi:hypothetical protein
MAADPGYALRTRNRRQSEELLQVSQELLRRPDEGANPLPLAIQTAPGSAGIEFIDGNGSGPGVRFREPQ